MAQISPRQSVLLISSLCSEERYRTVVSLRKKASLDPSQRLFSAVVEGLKDNHCDVTCISFEPFSANNTDLKEIPRSEEELDGVKYIYVGFRTDPVHRMLDIYRHTRQEALRWHKETGAGRKTIICDSLRFMASLPVRRFGKRQHIPTIAFVTDYPMLATSIKGKQGRLKSLFQNAFDRLASRDLRKYDAYIAVADGLRELIRPGKKPYLVIEDIIRVHGIAYEERSEKETFTFLYGGALCERFGVNKLVNAFQRLDGTNARLELYGSGESVPFIEASAQKDDRIVYGGVLPFEELMQKQKQADILVNPRPSDEVFSKYSFPSKTLSYMVSGTSVLSTRIPGIPADYEPYLYWFDAEDESAMAKRMEELTRQKKSELQNKGRAALEYAVENKNPLVQCKKIVDFISAL